MLVIKQFIFVKLNANPIFKYSSINENLPTTSYVKMIDIWLIFNLMKPFVDIMVQTYVETMREHPDEKEDEDDDVDIKPAWVVPGKDRPSTAELSR